MPFFHVPNVPTRFIVINQRLIGHKPGRKHAAENAESEIAFTDQ
jgi:hypothetical protein